MYLYIIQGCDPHGTAVHLMCQAEAIDTTYKSRPTYENMIR